MSTSYCSRFIDNYPGIRGQCERHLKSGNKCLTCPNRNILDEVRDLRAKLKVATKDTVRLTKLDRILQEDPFHLRIEWDNYQDSGVYIFDGLNAKVGHSEQKGEDESDAGGLTLRAAIDNIKEKS